MVGHNMVSHDLRDEMPDNDSHGGRYSNAGSSARQKQFEVMAISTEM